MHVAELIEKNYSRLNPKKKFLKILPRKAKLLRLSHQLVKVIVSQLKRSNMAGWIKVFREFADWEWFGISEMVHVFLYLLINASYEEKKWQGKVVEKGQLITSVDSIKCATNLSPKQIRTCLSRLEQTGEILRKTTNKFTTITICNYDRYQAIEDSKGQTKGNQEANKGQTKGNQRATSKEIKNIRNKEIEEYNSANALVVEPNKTDIPYDLIQQKWNEICTDLPQVLSLSPKRKEKIKCRLKEINPDTTMAIQSLLDIFKKIHASDFLCGRNSKWKASFDWVLDSPNNWMKIIEGNYNNHNNGTQTSNTNLEETARAIDLAFAMLDNN